jgi:hypothetical protein
MRPQEYRRAPALAALRDLPRVTAAQGRFAPPATTVAARRGYAYERKVGRVLRELCAARGWPLWDHQWFLYSSSTATYHFQPDFIIERPNERGIVVEVKLTYVDASAQLNKYLHHLKLFGIVCFPVTIVRHLTPNVIKDRVVDDFANLKTDSIWHLWI